MLKVWNIVLILLTFLLTLFGTFITRSGIISSVHSFGESSLGWIFLGFLVVVLSMSLALLIYRLADLKSKNQLDSLLSRESAFLYDNLLLVGIAFTVFWGTVFPIISEAVRGLKITVGPPFFNTVITPIGLGLLFLTGLCPLVAWQRSTFTKFLGRIVYPFALALTGAVAFLLLGIRSTYSLIAFSLCVFVTASLFLEFFNGVKARRYISGENIPLAFWNLMSRNKRRYGGYIIHFGMVLAFVALGGNAFNADKQITLRKGESTRIQKYTIRYDTLSRYPTAHKETVVASL
ncbi:MAG: heme lyase CcmF/NrfE family subunit, partial [Deltaproteobacteria bacterium]|nr:heme lyase CcmF/NrfE family subunit [Deltaproteobacteria bacterium]